MHKGFERGFIWKMTISSSAAYLWATVPQVYIDPLLTHHVRFPSRKYPDALYIIPLCVGTFLFTFWIMKKSRRALYCILPFVAASLLSVPIFRPEIPHGNLFTVSFIWMILATLTLWIHNRDISNSVMENLKAPDMSDKAAKIEYLKEEVQFWRVILIGLAGGYLALLISWANLIISFNKTHVGGNESDAFILNLMSGFGVGLCSIGLMVGPVAETTKRHQRALNLFLRIKEKEK